MKDYYRILQVHEEAEAEVIEAAYRRLMRKYHPDVLSPELRDDPDVLQRAKNINEAYEVLSDPLKRAAYDLGQEREELDRNDGHQNEQVTNIEVKVYEKSFLYVRCGQTKEVFKALLVREQNAAVPYMVLGFEAAPVYSIPEKSSVLKKISGRFTNRQSQSLVETYNFLESDALTDETIHKLLNEPPMITMGDINWGAHTCPACAGSIQNENGTLATWIGCSSCGRIRCAGGVEERKVGKFSTCPWCGKTNKLTRSVKPGQKDHLKLQGLGKFEDSRPKGDELEGKRRLKELPKRGRG